MSTEPTADSTAPVIGHAGRRELTDAREIRALAHPVRMGLLEALRREGTLTATEAAELLDESPVNCSFHLRTLAKYGFVEEAPGGTGRQRPWRRAHKALSYALDNPEAEVRAAAHELSKHFRDRLLQQQQNWEATWSSYEKPWRDAAFTFHGTSFLTADELKRSTPSSSPSSTDVPTGSTPLPTAQQAPTRYPSWRRGTRCRCPRGDIERTGTGRSAYYRARLLTRFIDTAPS